MSEDTAISLRNAAWLLVFLTGLSTFQRGIAGASLVWRLDAVVSAIDRNTAAVQALGRCCDTGTSDECAL